MNTAEVKKAITELAKEHEAIDEATIDDFKDAEFIEWLATNVLLAYCEHHGYQINGFPTEKRKRPEGQLDDDYFCRERFLLYLDLLTLEKDDVAEICWFFNNSFRPDQAKTKAYFIQEVKEQIETGIFYDVEL